MRTALEEFALSLTFDSSEYESNDGEWAALIDAVQESDVQGFMRERELTEIEVEGLKNTVAGVWSCTRRLGLCRR